MVGIYSLNNCHLYVYFSHQAGVHAVVGTPGRVIDLIAKRRVLDTRDIRMFVLDEADVMLSRGFKDDIYDIFKYLPTDVQVSFFENYADNHNTL